jgi:hypothetical protein
VDIGVSEKVREGGGGLTVRVVHYFFDEFVHLRFGGEKI